MCTGYSAFFRWNNGVLIDDGFRIHGLINSESIHGLIEEPRIGRRRIRLVKMGVNPSQILPASIKRCDRVDDTCKALCFNLLAVKRFDSKMDDSAANAW